MDVTRIDEMNHIEVKPLDETVFLDAMKKALSGGSDRLGCAVSFTGIVKRKPGEKVIERLHLGLTDDLEKRLRIIAEDVSRKYANPSVVIFHNLDDLRAKAVVTHIVVTGEHRARAFDAAREIIERIKDEIHSDSVETYEDY